MQDVGHHGFLAPGGAMNNGLGAGLSAFALIAIGITAARTPQLRAAAPVEPLGAAPPTTV